MWRRPPRIKPGPSWKFLMLWRPPRAGTVFRVQHLLGPMDPWVAHDRLYLFQGRDGDGRHLYRESRGFSDNLKAGAAVSCNQNENSKGTHGNLGPIRPGNAHMFGIDDQQGRRGYFTMSAFGGKADMPIALQNVR